MVVSQNGFSANDRSQIQTYQIGGKTKVALRKGSPGWLLQHLGNWFDANIRDIDPGILDDWGYAERPIRGGTELSNHASGTALDVDATKWPLGVEPTKYLTKEEIARLKAHLTVYEGAIRWGGDYTGRKDPMHFEINKPEAFCDRIQAKLSDGSYTPPTPSDEELTVAQIEQLVQLIQNNHRDMADAVWRGVAAAQQAVVMLKGNNPGEKNNFHWLAEQMVAAVKSIPGAQVDEEQLKAAIRDSVSFTEESIAKAAADEADRRARDSDPATGPVS